MLGTLIKAQLALHCIGIFEKLISFFLAGFPFISLAFDSAQYCMALGSTDGKVG